MAHKHNTFWKSLLNAFSGFKHAFSERNFVIQSVAAVLVIIAILVFELSGLEQIILILLIGMVLAAEMFNSAIEHLSDFVTEEHHHMIGKVKELSAAAVLLLSIVAAVVGLWILLPHIL